MQSSNPVFARSEGFNGRGQGASYASPSSWGTGAPGQNQGGYGAPQGYDTYAPQVPQDRMTIDTVVQKTATTVGIVVGVAFLTWVLTGDIASNADLALAGTLGMVGSIAAFGLAMFNSFKKNVSPALVIAFSVAEGVAMGGFSKVIDAQFGQDENIVLGAIVGTFAAAAGTLAAYKFFDIQVGDRFRKFVVAAGFGFVGLMLLDLVLGLFGNSFGAGGFGAMGMLFSVVGLALGVFFLILDFDFVERGIAAGLPEKESWRAAFGITLSLVWIYINMLKILAILQSD